MVKERGSKTEGSVDWLESLAVALETPGPLLVLCRTSATVRAVYRFLAERLAGGGRKGFPGLRVTTLATLFAEAAPRLLVPPQPASGLPELPDGHPWKAKLDGRPGLTGLLLQQMARVHETVLAGWQTKGLRAEVRALLTADWGVPEYLEGARRLLERRAEGRCLAIGFPPEPFSLMGHISPLVRTLLHHLEAQPIAAGNPAAVPDDPLPAIRLPDVAAEARAVANEALTAKANLLVLVASSTTAERVRAALARNGIATADDESDPVHQHALAALTSPLLPVFLSLGAEPLDARHLLRLLTDPVLSRTGDVKEAGKLHASVKHVRELIVSCRRVRATVDEWVKLTAGLVKDAEEDVEEADEDYRDSRKRRLASAQVLQAQVGLIATHAHGHGKLGDLQACLSEIGLSAPAEDRIGHAVLRALATARHMPADAESFSAALSGTVGSGRVDRGVEILSYDAYDGRRAGRLLLLDVHNKGLARIPEPNPFLSAEELQLVGIPTPVDCVRDRLAMARWAASRAGSTLALVTATDAGGRAVSPPVELKLILGDANATNAYGLGFDLPERRDQLALAEGKGKAGHLAAQVDVEWLRRGAWLKQPSTPGPALEGDAALPEYLDHHHGRLPDDLRPWLGEAGACPGSKDGLPAGFVASASRCGAFTSCLYRAFCASVLGLKSPQEIEEDLNAREVGSAVHASMKHALEGASLLLPADEIERARKEVLKRLRAALPKEAKRLADDMPGAAQQALVLSRKGLVARWSRFLEVYVSRRIRDVEQVEFAERKGRLGPLKDSKPFAALVAALGTGMAVSQQVQVERNAFMVLCRSGHDVDAFLGDATAWTSKLSAKNVGPLQAVLQTKGVKKLAAALCAEARPLLLETTYLRGGDLEVVRGELAFGDAGKSAGSHHIDIGREPLPVRGFIDLVVRHRGAEGQKGTCYHVIDFKTGKTRPHVSQIIQQVTEPQLAVYALALEALGPLEPKHGHPVRVTRVELDFLRDKPVPAWVDEEQRRHWREVLGGVFDRARDGSFPPLPHPDGCPLARYMGAYCDFTEVCRIRPESFTAAEGTHSEEGEAAP